MSSTLLEDLASRMGQVSPAWQRVTDAAPSHTDYTASFDLTSGVDRGVEAIREGWLLHRGASRLAPTASTDLALLLGDWCYAAGLCDVTEHGTLADVRVLADLIADVAARADESIDTLEPRWHDAVASLGR